MGDDQHLDKKQTNAPENINEVEKTEREVLATLEETAETGKTKAAKDMTQIDETHGEIASGTDKILEQHPEAQEIVTENEEIKGEAIEEKKIYDDNVENVMKGDEEQARREPEKTSIDNKRVYSPAKLISLIEYSLQTAEEEMESEDVITTSMQKIREYVNEAMERDINLDSIKNLENRLSAMEKTSYLREMNGRFKYLEKTTNEFLNKNDENARAKALDWYFGTLKKLNECKNNLDEKDFVQMKEKLDKIRESLKISQDDESKYYGKSQAENYEKSVAEDKGKKEIKKEQPVSKGELEIFINDIKTKIAEEAQKLGLSEKELLMLSRLSEADAEKGLSAKEKEEKRKIFLKELEKKAAEMNIPPDKLRKLTEFNVENIGNLKNQKLNRKDFEFVKSDMTDALNEISGYKDNDEEKNKLGFLEFIKKHKGKISLAQLALYASSFAMPALKELADVHAEIDVNGQKITFEDLAKNPKLIENIDSSVKINSPINIAQEYFSKPLVHNGTELIFHEPFADIKEKSSDENVISLGMNGVGNIDEKKQKEIRDANYFIKQELKDIGEDREPMGFVIDVDDFAKNKDRIAKTISSKTGIPENEILDYMDKVLKLNTSKISVVDFEGFSIPENSSAAKEIKGATVMPWYIDTAVSKAQSAKEEKLFAELFTQKLEESGYTISELKEIGRDNPKKIVAILAEVLGKNVEYDYDKQELVEIASEGGKDSKGRSSSEIVREIGISTPYNTLKTGKALSEGYSTLFAEAKKFLEKQGVPNLDKISVLVSQVNGDREINNLVTVDEKGNVVIAPIDLTSADDKDVSKIAKKLSAVDKEHYYGAAIKKVNETHQKALEKIEKWNEFVRQEKLREIAGTYMRKEQDVEEDEKIVGVKNDANEQKEVLGRKYMAPEKSLNTIKFLQGEGGKGSYWQAILELKNIMGSDFNLSIHDGILVYKKKEGESVEFQIQYPDKIADFAVDFSDSKNSIIGVTLTETEKNVREETAYDEKNDNTETISEEREESDNDEENVQKEYDDGVEKRIENWKNKNDEEKTEAIKSKKREIENDPRFTVPKEILQSKEEMKKYQDSLRESCKEAVKKREEVMKKIQEQLNGSIDLSELDAGNRSEYKDMLSDFKNISASVLDAEKIDYMMEAMEDKFGNLMDTHEDRVVSMEELEKMSEMIKGYEDFLERFEKMEEAEREKAKEEIIGLVGKIIEWCKEHPKATAAIAALIGGAAILLMSMGVPPASAGITPDLWKVAAGVGAAAAVATIYALRNNEKMRKALGVGKKLAYATPMLVAGGAMYLVDFITKGENWDKMAEYMFGGRVPSWARSKPEKK